MNWMPQTKQQVHVPSSQEYPGSSIMVTQELYMLLIMTSLMLCLNCASKAFKLTHELFARASRLSENFQNKTLLAKKVIVFCFLKKVGLTLRMSTHAAQKDHHEALQESLHFISMMHHKVAGVIQEFFDLVKAWYLKNPYHSFCIFRLVITFFKSLQVLVVKYFDFDILIYMPVLYLVVLLGLGGALICVLVYLLFLMSCMISPVPPYLSLHDESLLSLSLS